MSWQNTGGLGRQGGHKKISTSQESGLYSVVAWGVEEWSRLRRAFATASRGYRDTRGFPVAPKPTLAA